jgi:uncharacterized protein DUF6519
MRFRQVLAVTLTLGLLGTACVLPEFPQSAVPTKSEGQSSILQLDQPVRFLNSDGRNLNILSGTYQVTAPAPDTLQLNTISTGEAQTLHARSMAHTESLTAPYPFLIEEAGKQGHVHIVLLLPRGQGLDAEGRMEKIQTRGVGDLTRFAYTPTRQYSGVVMQQGRVTTDADINEQEAVSSSVTSGFRLNVAPFYGQVTLERGRIQLDAEARQLLHRKCRFCAKNQ